MAAITEESEKLKLKKSPPKYYEDTRKHYYLASNNESIATLKNRRIK